MPANFDYSGAIPSGGQAPPGYGMAPGAGGGPSSDPYATSTSIGNRYQASGPGQEGEPIGGYGDPSNPQGGDPGSGNSGNVPGAGPGPGQAAGAGGAGQAPGAPPPPYPQMDGPIRNSTGYKPAATSDEWSPLQTWGNERDSAAAGADVLDQGIRDFYNQAQQQAAKYGGQADDYFQDLMTNAGYSPEEAQGIIRDAETNGLKLSPEEFNARFLTGEEQGAMTGSPYAARDIYTGGADTARDTFHDNTGHVQSAVDNATGRVDETTGMARAGVGDATNRYNDSIDKAHLGVDPAFTGSISDLSGSADRDLSLSGRYMDKRGWSDEDVDAVRQRSARSAGTRYESAIDQVNRDAAAAGNTNPIALAAARLRLERSGAIDAADAMSNADVAAMGVAKGAEQDIENTRLDAAGRRIDTKTGLVIAGEDRRYRGEQAGLDARQHAADVETATQTDASHVAAQNAQYLGSLSTGTAERTRTAAADMDMSIADRTAGYTERGEGASVDRAGKIATNRQGTEVAGQDEKFKRGAWANEQLSGRTKVAADARRSDRAAAGGYWAAKGESSMTRAAQTLGARTDAYRAGTGATQGATQGYSDAYSQWKMKPTDGARAVGAAGGALSAWGDYQRSNKSQNTPIYGGGSGGSSSVIFS